MLFSSVARRYNYSHHCFIIWTVSYPFLCTASDRFCSQTDCPQFFYCWYAHKHARDIIQVTFSRYDTWTYDYDFIVHILLPKFLTKNMQNTGDDDNDNNNVRDMSVVRCDNYSRHLHESVQRVQLLLVQATRQKKRQVSMLTFVFIIGVNNSANLTHPLHQMRSFCISHERINVRWERILSSYAFGNAALVYVSLKVPIKQTGL